MQEILVLGAGKIGALITGLLADCGDYRVQLADKEAGTAEQVVKAHGHGNLDAFTLMPPMQRALAPIFGYTSPLP